VLGRILLVRFLAIYYYYYIFTIPSMALAWGITPGRCCSVSFDIGIRPGRLTAAGVGWVLFPYSLVYLIEVSGIY
jgi:hypothetical protein